MNTIQAKENWWGSTDLAEIGKMIEDAADNDDWGKVVIEPVLTSAPSS